MYFDAREAKLLKPKAYLLVEGCPGLRLAAAATKKTWVYRFKDPATDLMKQTKIGSWPSMPPEEAKNEWQKLRGKREAGVDILADKKADSLLVKSKPDAVYTFGQMIEDYAKGHLDVLRKPVGARAVRLQLNNALSKHIDLPVSISSRRFVFDLIESISGTPMLAKNVKSQMGAATEYALNAGRIDQELPNWWRQVKGQTLRSKGAVRDGVHKGTAKRVLKDAEIAALIRVDLDLLPGQVSDFLVLQLWTCTRGAEIVQMHRSHFTQEADGFWWTIPKELTKNLHVHNATDLRVPIIGRALDIVQRRLAKQSSGWLFPRVSVDGVLGSQVQSYMSSKVNYIQPYSKREPSHIRQRLSVTHWSPHDLRRTGRTKLAAISCPKEIAEEILGHIKPGVEGMYNLYEYDRERRHWLTLLDAKYEEIISMA
jgi:integrase